MTKTQQTKPRAGQLKLSLLGIPEVRLGSRQLAFRTRKVKALLVYLALEPGFHSRDKLIALLWPDADQSKGRGNLRMALARLRDDLEDASSVLLIQRDAIGIQTHTWDLDVQILETAFNQVGGLDLEEKLVAAMNLFRGDLLEGFYLGDAPEFDDWLVAEREVVRDRIDALLERLTALQRQSGKLAAALETAQRRIRLEPLNEAAHRQVIELHLAGENRTAALEAFNACAKLLQRELGLEPDSQTQSLLGDIQTSSVMTVTAAQPQALEPTRLIGREREWAQMEAAWQAGQAIVLHGAPGVGKSRLLLEFAASRGAYLHWLGRPGDPSIPYGTHARTFKPLCEALGSAGLPNWVRSELARIVPGLGKAPAAISSDGERLRFLEAKAEALELFFAKGHAALVYDDLQFVDSASLEAAWYILNKFLPAVPGKPRPILGFRTDELSNPFLQTLQQAVGSGVAVMIEVKPLEPQAVAQMLQDLNLSDQLGPNLHRFTGGNPLFLLETLRSLTERGGLESLTPERFENRRRMAGLARSPKVQAIIERRLEHLSNPALDLSRVAAVMGEYFSFELGAKVLGKEPLETARVAEELEAAQVLRGARFTHDLIFESVLEKIPETFLRLLHEQILKALEGRDVPPVVRLKHAIGATSAQAITQHALAAAEEASKLYAHEEIFFLLKQAASLFEGLGLHSEAARILTTLAAAMTHTGRVIESLETHLQALDLYRRLGNTDSGDADSLAQVHLQLSLLYRTLGEAQQSQHFAQMALEHFRQRGDLPHVARALWRLGEAHWWLREYAQAQVHLAEAYELGQHLRDPEVTVWVQKTLGQNAYFLGRPAQALELLQAAVEQAAALNDRIALGWVHFDMARVQLAMGLYEDARKHNQAALDLFEQSGHKAAIRVTKVELGQLAAIDGRLSEAELLLTHSYQAVLESRENDAFSDMLIADATLLMQQNRKETAAMLVLSILAQPLKDNPFAHVRANQVLNQLEQDLSPAKIAHARKQARDTAGPQIVQLLETI